MSERKVLIGADPELFVFDTKKRTFLSAHSFFPGSKYDPFYTAKGAIQVDGVSAEFNIDPAEDSDTFCENISQVTNAMKIILKTKGSADLTLFTSPVAEFEKEYFDNLPAETKVLGCEPDFNAYTGKPNKMPRTSEPFRTGAGHIHVGWTEDQIPNEEKHFFDCCQLTKQLDATLYIMSLAWDWDTKRRSLYGAAGAFRPKEYGVEYRVLSNAWVGDADLQEWIFDTTLEAELALTQGDLLFENPIAKHMLSEVNRRQTVTRKELEMYEAFLCKHGMPELPNRAWAM